MGSALYLRNFYLSQMRLLVSHNGQDPETKLEGYFLKIKDLLKRKGSLTARKIQRAIWSLRVARSAQVRPSWKVWRKQVSLRSVGRVEI